MDNDKLAALDKAARQTADDIIYYSGGSKHNEPLEQLKTALVNAYRAGELVPVSLDTDTAGLCGRLKALRITLKSGDYDDGDLVRAWYAMAQAATALRTITAERDALAKRVGELEGEVEALEAALKYMADTNLIDDDYRDIARAALKGTDA
ncbi:MAG: hypothetical protein ACOYBR_10360 [Fluviibacter sp.]